MSRDSFVIVREQRPAFDCLSDEDAGRLVKAVLAYQFDGIEPNLPPVPQMAFAMMKPVFERFAAKYAETCRKRKEAGAKGGKAKAANASKCQTGQANVANASNAKQSLHDRDRDRDRVPDRDPIREEKRTHTHIESHDLYAPQQAQCACASFPPLNGEDIAERRDAAQAHHRRGDYEFSLIRQAYDAVKAEAPQAGYPEFLRLYNSTEWRAGMHEEVLHGLDALAKGDRQFLGEERYRPGLAKFLTQEMWKMKPRAPDGQSGVKTPEDEELERRVQENERKMRQRMAERKKLLG